MADLYDRNSFETGNRKQIRLWFDIETGPSDEQLNLADWVLCWAEKAHKAAGNPKTAENMKYARWALPRTASDLHAKETETKRG